MLRYFRRFDNKISAVVKCEIDMFKLGVDNMGILWQNPHHPHHDRLVGEFAISVHDPSVHGAVYIVGLCRSIF